MGEFQRIMRSALDFLDTGNPFALATVVRVRGAAPRHSGARMLVFPDGRTEGTVGGATLEQRVIQHALEALREGRPRYETYLFSTRPEDKDKSVGLCGGEVDIHIDVVKPDPRLMIIGAGHIAIPLARMAAILDMRVVVVDDRPDYATRERFPDAEEIHIVRYDEEREELAPIEAVVDSNTFVVVATWGWDQPALAQVLTRNPAYVALVASPAKARAIFQGLLSQGIPEARLAEVRTPAGLDIGAETPAEIALSILAEILSVRRSRGGKPMRETRRQGAPPQE
ncbi:MAG: XdhC family protein [Thermodesulfobacteriota bacterium]